VSDAIRASLPRNHSVRRKLRWPISYKPAPAHNVAAAATEGVCFRIFEGNVQTYPPNRFKAMISLGSGLLKAASKKHAGALRNDSILGQVQEPPRPASVPSDAQWLGGLGEGAWHALEPIPGGLRMQRIDASGVAEFEGTYEYPSGDHPFDHPVRLVHDSHHGWITVFHAGKVHRLRRIPS
jgi:hypothetical protein